MRPKQTDKEDGRLVRGEATRERVVDAAERLFADHGFDAVSIRQIAAEAGVTLGVVGFHSGSKEDLFTTILKRRVDAVSAARRERLAILKTSGNPIELNGLMAAYIEPYIDFAANGGRQWFAYARLIAHVSTDTRWYPTVRELYDPVAHEFIEEISAMYPQAGRKEVAAALVMSVAAMLSTVASTVRMESLARRDGDLPSESVERLEQHRRTLIDFCTGGIESAISER